MFWNEASDSNLPQIKDGLEFVEVVATSTDKNSLVRLLMVGFGIEKGLQMVVTQDLKEDPDTEEIYTKDSWDIVRPIDGYTALLNAYPDIEDPEKFYLPEDMSFLGWGITHWAYLPPKLGDVGQTELDLGLG